MGYGRLGSPESNPSEFTGNAAQQPQQPPQATADPQHRRRRRLLFLSLFATLFLVVSAASIAALIVTRRGLSTGRGASVPKPTQAISQTCSLTRYPSLCVQSLMEFPGATEAGRRDLVHISVNMTMHRVGRALYGAGAVTNLGMAKRLRAAYDDCMELLEDSLSHLTRSLSVISPAAEEDDRTAASGDDVVTWLSASLTNQDTCFEGLDAVEAPAGGGLKDEVTGHMKDLNELLSNSLAIFALSSDAGGELDGVPVQNRRKLLGTPEEAVVKDDVFPSWVGKKDRHLLQAPASSVQADFVVSKGEKGYYWSIADAVKAAPDNSARRIVIYIKAGRYEESIKVARKKTNLMFIGDGMGKTVISGSKSVYDDLTTFHTATFATTGAGFIARDITFENTAGPSKHQAVALRVGADHSVVYRCAIMGYQDTLYVHSQRQFYRECDIYGTVDFIFGNAAVVLQKCNIISRKPMDMQKDTITAQNRKDPNQNTGISIHGCRILPGDDLAPVKGRFPTYLGRPWKMYARVVYLMSYIGDHVDPRGWLEWNGDFALDTLYYGEYMNTGPGAAVGGRVKWPGYRVITMEEEASRFTVGRFIGGTAWLPSTGVAFLAGLST